MPTPPPPRAPSYVWRPIAWRGIAFLVVFTAGWIGFLSGVEVAERDLSGVGVAGLAYYTLGLFVLGGMDLGTPVGGPTVGQALLWASYFLAPVITASALLETAMRLMAPLAIRLRPLRNHVVVAGAGRLSVLFIRRLRERDPRRTIVVVEVDPQLPRLRRLRDLYRVVVVNGDITSDDVLRSLRLRRARRIALLTGDDFANLDAAAKILTRAPDLAGRIVAHVSDLRFMRKAAGSSVVRDSEVFNGHEFAAIHLVRDQLVTRFHSTPERDLVVLAGFGRFGQTVLNHLQLTAAGSFGHVVLIDLHATANARAFEDEPGFVGDFERTIIDGDLLDPHVWTRVEEITRREGHAPVVVVGSGNDGTNLHVALHVREEHPGSYVIARSFEASPFTAEIAREANIRTFNLAELIEGGMPDRWF